MNQCFAKIVVVLAALTTCCGIALGDEYTDAPKLLQPRVPRDSRGREQLLAETMLMEARILERRGDNASALRKYQRAWRLAGRSTTILKQIVPLALELGRVEEATRYALLLAESDLDDPFLAERLAMLMSDQLEFDRSLQLYQRVLKLRSEDVNTRHPVAMQFEMGRLFFITGKYEQAAQSFRVVLRAIQDESPDAATAAFREAILQDAKSIYTLIAEAFLEAGHYAEAAATYRTANQESPDQQWLTLQLARVDHRAGRFEAAQEKLQTYVKQKLRFGGQTPYELLQSMMEKALQENAAEQPDGDPSETKVTAQAKSSGEARDATASDAITDNTAADNESSSNDDGPSGDPRGTFVRFRDWLADDPDNFPLLSYVAEMTRRQGVLQEAATLYEESIKRTPTVEGFQKLLHIYRELGDNDRLLETLCRILTVASDFEAFADEVKTIVADQELLQNLLQLGRDRLAGDPANSREITIACGLLALEGRDYVAAEAFFARLTDASREVDVYTTWGLQLLADEEFERAAKVFQIGLLSARDANAQALLRYYLSGALQLSGETELALQVANDVAREATNIPEFALRPAWILYNADRANEAKQGYEAWLEKHAEDYSIPGLREVVRDARFIVSNICVDLGEIDNAIESLEKILDEYPEDTSAMNDLGYLLVDNNRSLERATEMIRVAVRQHPDNLMFRDSLGWALFRLGKFSEALVELQKAASEDTPDPIILDHLADAQRATGDEAAAQETWKRALRLLESGSDEELVKKIKGKLESKLVTAEKR